MRILIPGKKDQNPFFDEILNHSEIQYNFSSVRQDLGKKGDAILIQWPETLCNWKKVSKTELQRIFSFLEEWRETSRIIYLVHNERNHLGASPEWEQLYRKVEEISHVMVHLGNFSKNKYQNKYPEKSHIYIPHPLYRSSYKNYEMGEARQKLGIDSGAVVLFAGGRIRNLKERKLVLQAFRSIETKNKVLLSSNMYWRGSSLEFRGRHRLKKIWDVRKTLERLKNNYKRPRFIFNYSFTDAKNLSLMISASDIVMVPRYTSMNSGIPFLGLSFNKVVYGPSIGNMEEVLEMFNFPSFNPFDKKSISKGMVRAVEMAKKEIPFDRSKLRIYDPVVVAAQWDKLLKEAIIK